MVLLLVSSCLLEQASPEQSKKVAVLISIHNITLVKVNSRSSQASNGWRAPAVCQCSLKFVHVEGSAVRQMFRCCYVLLLVE